MCGPAGHFNSSGYEEARLRHSYPYDSGDPGTSPDDGWKTHVSVDRGYQVATYATCAKPEPVYRQHSVGTGALARGLANQDCPPGLEAVSGGTSGNPNVNEVGTRPGVSLNWFLAFDNRSQSTHSIQTYAICLKREVFITSDDGVVETESEEGNGVDSPGGTRVVGGGVSTNAPFRGTSIASSSPQGFAHPAKDGWQGYVDNFNDSTVYSFSVFATCVKPLN